VIHAGIYYKRTTRPLKARLCVAGNRLLYEFCEEFGVPHARTGKLVVATSERENAYLLDVLATARENGVPDVRLLDAAEQRAIEPRIASTQSLHVPTSGVIDAAAYLDELRRRAQAHDLFHTRLEAVTAVPGGFEVVTRSPTATETFRAGAVINAAGLHADEVARMIDPDAPYRIMAVRGEAARFSTARRDELALSGMNIYPTPRGFYTATGAPADVSIEEFHTLLASRAITDTVGVHLTPTLDADGKIATTMTISPLVVTNVAKDDYRPSVAREVFWQRVRAFFPGLRPDDIELHDTGIQARLPDQLDWVIEPARTAPRFINLIGIDSPGLTSSLAIARYVVDEVLSR
jgi:L-2-hydroxyglutarate oxidase LhgO